MTVVALKQSIAYIIQAAYKLAAGKYYFHV